ncbi:MAG TPA: Hpt domain-containing protein [Gemmatimonadales bacterium]|nr:Hpt domain-containing protein [Gemmatimonadales bacterium]
MTPPQKPLGMSDFFALEAGEYLERLDALLGSESPSADELVRLARALRGSALMANQQAIARAAAGLEALMRAVRENRRAWDPQTKQLAVRGVDDLKKFVRQASAWTEADTGKAEVLAQELEQAAGRPSAQVRAAEALGLDAGVRAFVAREGAAIASALDRASQTLKTNPAAPDPLPLVLRTLQPLRGLAAVNDLPPLPDLLEGIERAVGDAAQPGLESRGKVDELFKTAALAIARAAREVAERGRPDPDSADFRQFAGLLVKFMENEPDVVSIGSLYYSDSGPHIVTRGVPAARPSTLGRLELVSHGEHLRQAADSLERAPSTTQRELRAHTLGTTFRALANAGGGALADRVAQFAIAAREAVASGIAVSSAPGFAALLRQAGDLLARSSASAEEALAAELDRLTTALRALKPGAPPSPPAPAPAPASRAPVVPPPSRPQPPSAAPAPVPETPDLVGSWSAYQRMTGAGIGAASLQELLAPSSAAASPFSLAPPAPAPAADAGAVDVRTLVYRGDRALARAQELRLVAKQASGDTLRALVDEVCDLVALALEPSPPPGP